MATSVVENLIRLKFFVSNLGDEFRHRRTILNFECQEFERFLFALNRLTKREEEIKKYDDDDDYDDDEKVGGNLSTSKFHVTGTKMTKVNSTTTQFKSTRSSSERKMTGAIPKRKKQENVRHHSIHPRLTLHSNLVKALNTNQSVVESVKLQQEITTKTPSSRNEFLAAVEKCSNDGQNDFFLSEHFAEKNWEKGKTLPQLNLMHQNRAGDVRLNVDDLKIIQNVNNVLKTTQPPQKTNENVSSFTNETQLVYKELTELIRYNDLLHEVHWLHFLLNLHSKMEKSLIPYLRTNVEDDKNYLALIRCVYSLLLNGGLYLPILLRDKPKIM